MAPPTQAGSSKERSRPYTPTENEALRLALADGKDLADIAQSLGRTRAAIALRVRELELVAPRRWRRWLAEEDAVVRRGYEDGLTCAARLRTLLSVRVSVEQVAQTLVRTPEGIRQRARALGLTLPPVYRARAHERWTEREDALLRSQARADEVALAQLLGRSASPGSDCPSRTHDPCSRVSL